jgi:hypothetical protein
MEGSLKGGGVPYPFAVAVINVVAAAKDLLRDGAMGGCLFANGATITVFMTLTCEGGGVRKRELAFFSCF